MAGDRSGYRHFYPRVLSLSQADVQKWMDQGLSKEELADAKDLLQDTQDIRGSVVALPWPEDEMIDLIRANTLEICLIRFAQVSSITEIRGELLHNLDELGISRADWSDFVESFPAKLTDEHLRTFESMNVDWKDMFVRIPARRLSAAICQWKVPFDAIDSSLGEHNFPIPDDYLDEMHSQITRGHNWFGVGEWNVANRRYLRALSIALSTNNIPAIEMIVRFLVDTYAASGDFHSATRITEDYLASSACEESALASPAQMIGSVIVALALAGRWTESKEWINRVLTLPNTEPNVAVAKWNIVELLRDVHSFRKNHVALSRIDTVVTEITRYLQSRT